MPGQWCWPMHGAGRLSRRGATASVEVGYESPRVWRWGGREKLLLMVTLVFAFLLSLMAAELGGLREEWLRLRCHRRGKRSREVAAPLSFSRRLVANHVYSIRAAKGLGRPTHRDSICIDHNRISSPIASDGAAADIAKEGALAAVVRLVGPGLAG